MTDRTLLELLAGNGEHVNGLPDGYFDGVRDAQRPAAVAVCCSDSRVSQEGMWTVDEPGWLFAPSNVGNVAWDRHRGERVVDGNLLYPLVNTGTRVAVVVGHTGCGAVTAAYRAVAGDEGGGGGGSGQGGGRDRGVSFDGPPGIARRVDLLIPVVDVALERGIVDADVPESTAVNRLVEYNVVRQAAFLRAADVVPDAVTVYGFVYDFQEVYGDVPGRAYLVDLDGETDPDAIREALPQEYGHHARRLLA